MLRLLGRWIGRFFGAIKLLGARLGVGLANARRRLAVRRLPDYIVITLDQPLTERAPAEPWWYHYIPARRPTLSLEALDQMLGRIAPDPAVTGVVFLVKGAALTMAQAQSMHALLTRFRARSDEACGRPKAVAVYLESMSSAAYVFACAADMVVAPPLASWDVTGLQVAPIYLKETLARIGVDVDVVKIAPWKTAADALSRRDMSDEERAQLNWLLDSLYRDVVDAVSNGRNLSPARVQTLIDQAPLSATQALEAGLVDAVGYEDELGTQLAGRSDDNARLVLKPYSDVRKLLLRKVRVPHGRAVGVIALEGNIFTGESRRFPVPLPVAGERTIGSTTAQQLVRAALDDERLAAVVVYVDSGGGSALASDLIWRELTRLDAQKPVIVYMGDTAASGGYYIATPGRCIVAQAATLTGSIGVIVAKARVTNALTKVGAHPDEVHRGANAGIYRAAQPWSDAQRANIVDQVEQVYATFKSRVADGRNLPLATLDNICNGRVWTGTQARAVGLVDHIGDFHVAYTEACRAAGLPEDGSVPTQRVTAPKQTRLAAPLDAAAAWLLPGQARHWVDLLAAFPDGPFAQSVRREHVWLLSETTFRVDA